MIAAFLTAIDTRREDKRIDALIRDLDARLAARRRITNANVASSLAGRAKALRRQRARDPLLTAGRG